MCTSTAAPIAAMRAFMSSRISIHFAGGLEPATYDHTQPVDADGGMVIMGVFTGVDTTTPIEGRVQNTGGQTQTCTDVTPSMDNCWDFLVFTEVEGPSTITTPPTHPTLGAYTQLAYLTNHGMAMAIYYKDLGTGSSGVAQGTPALVWNNAGAFGYWQRFLLRPAVGGGGGGGSRAALHLLGMF